MIHEGTRREAEITAESIGAVIPSKHSIELQMVTHFIFDAKFTAQLIRAVIPSKYSKKCK